MIKKNVFVLELLDFVKNSQVANHLGTLTNIENIEENKNHCLEWKVQMLDKHCRIFRKYNKISKKNKKTERIWKMRNFQKQWKKFPKTKF